MVNNKCRTFAVALVLLAFAVRLWGLNATSLWYDETFMLTHAQQGVVRGVLGLLREDNALPLHGLLLALWVQVAGGGEFAARFLSVLLGTLTVPLVLRLARALLGRPGSGWGPALACALLPIHVYYSQEVRMYALAVPLAAAFAWTGWRVARHGRGAGTYVAFGVAMLAAHLYTGLLWAAVLLWGTLSLRSIPRSVRRAWLRANGGLALTALPIAAWAAWRAQIDATATSAIPASTLRWIPSLFGVGQYLPEPWSAAFAVLSLCCVGIALLGLLRARRFEGALWIVLALIVPVLLLLAATAIKAKWSERYLLPSFGLALVVGVGLGWEVLLRAQGRARAVARVGGLLALAGWITLAVPALARQAEGTWAVGVIDEWHPRPDFRGAARYIAAHDAPGDAVVVIGGYAAHTFDYYYDGPAHVFGLPYGTRLLDTAQALDLAALETLEREAGDAERLWIVLWQDRLADPVNLVQSTLVESCHRLDVGASFTNVGLLLFDLVTCRPLDRLATPPHPLDVAFDEPIRLTGYDLVRTGETWALDLWWETAGPLAADYGVYVHLLGPDGVLVAQGDHIAGDDAYPTSRWPSGTRLRDRFFLTVPGGTCPGCTLRVGLYLPDGRLGVQGGGDGVELSLGLSKE